MPPCNRVIERPRSTQQPDGGHRCHLPENHEGCCDEHPALADLRRSAPSVAEKIRRDATRSTGAAWESDNAGANRINRWVMLKSYVAIYRDHGVDVRRWNARVRKRHREKAAAYSDCVQVVRKLAWLAYGMRGAPTPSDRVRVDLENQFGPIGAGTTTCLICARPLSFASFDDATPGKAEIETAHSHPRRHTPDNVGFAHRFCNIAQGDKSLEEFLDWMEATLRIHGRIPR